MTRKFLCVLILGATGALMAPAGAGAMPLVPLALAAPIGSTTARPEVVPAQYGYMHHRGMGPRYVRPSPRMGWHGPRGPRYYGYGMRPRYYHPRPVMIVPRPRPRFIYQTYQPRPRVIYRAVQFRPVVRRPARVCRCY